MNCLTVFTDASHSNGASGYAFWGKVSPTVQYQGSGTWPCENSYHAEIYGLCVGIMETVRHTGFSDGFIVAQSDSTSALGALVWGAWAMGENGRFVRRAKGSDSQVTPPKRLSGWQEKVVRQCLADCLKANVLIWVKHVKAHTNQQDSRSKVNAWCDQEAKRARKICAAQIAARLNRSEVLP